MNCPQFKKLKAQRNRLTKLIITCDNVINKLLNDQRALPVNSLLYNSHDVVILNYIERRDETRQHLQVVELAINQAIAANPNFNYL